MNQSKSLNLKRTSIYLFFVLLIGGCSFDKGDNQPENCDNKKGCHDSKIYVQLKTNVGTIILNLYSKTAPVTTDNFLKLVDNGVYDGTVFHKVIREPLPFIIQGGDPLSKDSKISKYQIGTGSYIDKVTGKVNYIPLEIKLLNEKLPRYNKVINNPLEVSQIEHPHVKGTLSMARSRSLNSASSQFYISLKSLPELDGRYTVFGKVVEGMKLLDSIKQGDYILSARKVKLK